MVRKKSSSTNATPAKPSKRLESSKKTLDQPSSSWVSTAAGQDAYQRAIEAAEITKSKLQAGRRIATPLLRAKITFH